MTTSPARIPRGDATRDALIAAALPAFGQGGFDGVSLRALAERADVNQALIGYHFGSKRGLYLAVFSHIAEQVHARLGPTMQRMETALGAADRITATRALAMLQTLEDRLLDLMTQPTSDGWAQLIVREQQNPTEAFDILYEGFMGRFLGLLTRLVRLLRPDFDDASARLQVLTLLGQILIFRIARAGALRVLDRPGLDDDAVEIIRQRVHANTRAMLAPAP